MLKTQTLDRRHRPRTALRLSFQINSDDGKPFFVESINFNETGACLISKEKLSPGSKIKIETLFNGSFRDLTSYAKVKWVSTNNGREICGIKFIIEEDIESVFKELTLIYSPKKVFGYSALKLILTVGVPLIPILAITFKAIYPDVQGGTAFAIFIVAVAAERLWETFFTSKEVKPTDSSQDWTMTAVSFYYILMIDFIIIEFFFFPKTFSILIFILGCFLFIFSLSLRWWGMTTLKDQWAIHAIAESRLSTQRKKLITTGPYGYVRHPIYLGVILELLAIPIISHSFLTLIFVLSVNIPLQILRSKLEERKMVNEFGYDYIKYRNLTPALIPKSLISKKLN